MMFGKRPPDEPPLTQQEVNNLEDGETVIVEPPRTKPSEWTISTEGTVRVAEKFGHRLVLEPVGDGFEDTCVWRSYETADGFEVDAEAIVSDLENYYDE
jgi:hypothetical protein